MSDRRNFLQRALGIGAGLIAAPALADSGVLNVGAPAGSGSGNNGPASSSAAAIKQGARNTGAGRAPVPVVTTDIPDLPCTLEDGWKTFHLRAEPVRREIVPGKTVDLWGFNGSAPGPTIQVTQGDRVRVYFENGLPEPTSIHWHGFEDRIRDDGMPNISQRAVPPGGSYTYEFTIHQTGTFFYHSHMAMQEMVGMLGGFIMHPREAHTPPPDHDFLLHLQEYAVLPSSTVPNSMNMEYNWLVLNGKSGPAPTPLVVRQGSRVRIRFVNLGMDHHPMHLHGHTFYITGTEGGRIPETAWWPGNTVLVGVAQAREIEFVANNPGDWMLHCHLPHHMMNQMSSNVGRMSRLGAGKGIPAGIDMENGMGMLNGTPTVPLGDDYGASLGRGMGMASTSDMATTNGMLTTQQSGAGAPQHPMQQGAMPMKPGEPRAMNQTGTDEGMQQMMQEGKAKLQVAPDANTIPNYPQDAFMEGPMMNMDAMVDKPENFGLPRGWSENMQGMMTFVRVLPPDKYQSMVERIAAAKESATPAAMTMPVAEAVSAVHRAPATKHTQQAAPVNPAMKMDLPMPAPDNTGGGR